MHRAQVEASIRQMQTGIELNNLLLDKINEQIKTAPDLPGQTVAPIPRGKKDGKA